jgi:tRNA nucleotidyltransferase/poly(A) polymerase
VEGDGLAIAQALAAATGGEVLSYAQFGTATVRWAGAGAPCLSLDVATCRKETYARPAAYPRVSPGTITEDLFRRDFTLNAMAVHLAQARWGELLDPFAGAADLQAGQLRVLHARSFLDDPSRILRGVRLLQRFGLQWEPQTHQWLREAMRQGALGWLNAGRLEKELGRLAEEPQPGRCLATLADLLAEARRRGPA